MTRALEPSRTVAQRDRTAEVDRQTLLGLRPVFLVMGALTLTLLIGMKVVTDEAMDTAERDADGA